VVKWNSPSIISCGLLFHWDFSSFLGTYQRGVPFFFTFWILPKYPSFTRIFFRAFSAALDLDIRQREGQCHHPFTSPCAGKQSLAGKNKHRQPVRSPTLGTSLACFALCRVDSCLLGSQYQLLTTIYSQLRLLARNIRLQQPGKTCLASRVRPYSLSQNQCNYLFTRRYHLEVE
jgi:hypothetical protein